MADKTRAASKISTFAARLSDKTRRMLGVERPAPALDSYWRPTQEAQAGNAHPSGPLSDLFFANTGRIVDKWLHYFPIYERYLAKYRGTDFRMLEIGVFKGGSLDMWRKYFGADAVLFGVDIDPSCADYVDLPNVVRIGSQDDPEFLTGVVKEMGELDVVLDDGSHIGRHQQTSFETLFPLLKDGGLYIIEDTHTSYWRGVWEGGYRQSGSAIELAKRIVDDQHHWYHGRSFVTAARDHVGAVHIHDSVIVIEKRAPIFPIRTQVGTGSAPH